MDLSPRTVALVLILGAAAIFSVFDRTQSAALRGPAPDGARYRLSGNTPSGSLALSATTQEATFSFAPEVAASDRELVRSAVAGTRPEARRLVAMIDGLVDISVGDSGDGTAGRTMIGGPRYPMILDLATAWQRGSQRAANRLVLHELGHVIDDALLTDDVVAPLVAAVPAGWGCDQGVGGACAPDEERFAESFAKWATGDIGIDVQLGYAVPPPSPSLESWGRALAGWNG